MISVTSWYVAAILCCYVGGVDRLPVMYVWVVCPVISSGHHVAALSSLFNPFPHPGNSTAKPFRRGTAWPSSATLRELGRLRHLVGWFSPWWDFSTCH